MGCTGSAASICRQQRLHTCAARAIAINSNTMALERGSMMASNAGSVGRNGVLLAAPPRALRSGKLLLQKASVI